MAAEREPEDPRCVDCGAAMLLQPARGGGAPFFMCFGCGASMIADPRTGAPAGWMGDRETRRARHRAHQAVDALWTRYGMSREAVYRWIAVVMGVGAEDAHMSRFTRDQCDHLVARVEWLVSKLRG